MKLENRGFCIYHDVVVTDELCFHKEKRCLTCEYFISKEKYMTVEEACDFFGKSPATVRSWIKKGKLKAESYDFVNKYSHKVYRYKVYFIERESANMLKK